MNQLEFKEALLNTGVFVRTGRRGQYRCRECPFCGDIKNHVYVKIVLEDDTEPVVYYCFKCNAHGLVNREFLEFYGIENITIPKSRRKRKIDVGVSDASKLMTLIGDNDASVEYAKRYIQQRVGVIPSMDELNMFQVIGNGYSYAKEFLGGNLSRIESDRVWFRCTNGTMIGRKTHDNVEHRWVKYTGDARIDETALYTIKKPVDLHQAVNVMICEGVMDCIGLYYHAPIENCVYIACLGSEYNNGIRYMLNRGIFGDSITIRVMKDADVKKVKLNHRLTQFFKSVSVYQNTSSKDFGVCADKISIEKCF